MAAVEPQLLVYAAIGLVAGGALFLFPHGIGALASENHSQRSAELEAGASEHYFEELRELKAYPPPTTPKTIRVVGSLLFLLSAATIALSVL